MLGMDDGGAGKMMEAGWKAGNEVNKGLTDRDRMGLATLFVICVAGAGLITLLAFLVIKGREYLEDSQRRQRMAELTRCLDTPGCMAAKRDAELKTRLEARSVALKTIGVMRAEPGSAAARDSLRGHYVQRKPDGTVLGGYVFAGDTVTYYLGGDLKPVVYQAGFRGKGDHVEVALEDGRTIYVKTATRRKITSLTLSRMIDGKLGVYDDGWVKVTPEEYARLREANLKMNSYGPALLARGAGPQSYLEKITALAQK